MNAAGAHTIEACDAPCDPVLYLPRELVYATVRLLDIRDRVAVSHVSRNWRAVALADTFLWQEADLSPPDLNRYPVIHRGPSPPQRKANMLLELLARSYPLPFTLTWFGEHAPDVPHNVVTVIAQHMGRMQALALNLDRFGFRRLLEATAPALKSFCCTISDMQCDFPARWDAPVLEKLEMRPIRIAAGMQPMPSVRYFSGYVALVSGDAGARLFSIFPSLCSLKIESLTADTLPALSDPPMSLAHIYLRARPGSTQVYATFLRAYMGRNIRTLHLEDASSWVEALYLFTSVVAGTWCMRLEEREVYLTAPDENVIYTIVCAKPPSLSREPHIVAHLARVASLIAHAQFLIDLDALGSWSRVLPRLSDLTLHFAGHTLMEPLPPLVKPPPILVPCLETLTFRFNFGMLNWQGWVMYVFPQFLRSRLSLARPRLSVITVDTWLERGPEGVGLAALRALADRMRVNLRKHGKTVEYGCVAN